jgi:hypothetical protein
MAQFWYVKAVQKGQVLETPAKHPGLEGLKIGGEGQKIEQRTKSLLGMVNGLVDLSKDTAVSLYPFDQINVRAAERLSIILDNPRPGFVKKHDQRVCRGRRARAREAVRSGAAGASAWAATTLQRRRSGLESRAARSCGAALRRAVVRDGVRVSEDERRAAAHGAWAQQTPAYTRSA